MSLGPFDPASAELVLSWARGPVELDHWASLAGPVDAHVFERWLADPDAHGYLLLADAPVAYGELWVSVPEDEVEIAHVLVSDAHRSRGIGRRLVLLLIEEARSFGVGSVWVRVVPENEPALRCYSGAGFATVSAAEEAKLNDPQPRAYRWLRLDLRDPAHGRR